MLNDFEKKVLSAIRAYSMLERGDHVLVGLSGGKDSAVLLYVLHSLSSVLGIRLSAFHLNHMIRGDEAERDARFSRELCESLDIPFYTESIDVPSLADGRGLEAVARDVRYRAFEKYSKHIGANKIATAHTLSDNTETLMISLIRSGTLSQIPAVRENIVRPLIETTTEEVLLYAKEKNIPYVTDSTNGDTEYLRNFLRLSILPELRLKQEGFDNTLCKAGKIYASYKALASELADEYFEKNENPESLDSLKALAVDRSRSAVLYCVLSRICERHGISLTYERFEALSQMIGEGQVGKSVSLSSGKKALMGYGKLIFEDSKDVLSDYRISLNRGKNDIPNSPYAVYFESEDERNQRLLDNQQKINKKTKIIQINGSIITSGLYLRPKLDGDKFRCRGITRSVKKFFIDSKLDRALREVFPILCDSEGIVWVAGIGLADRVAEVKDGELFYLSLEIKE